MTSATESAEIGEVITAGAIETNVHIRRHPTSSDTVLLLHGSGPRVSAFANWRLTIPYLEQEMTVIAPDIVGFGFTERPRMFPTISRRGPRTQSTFSMRWGLGARTSSATLSVAP